MNILIIGSGRTGRAITKELLTVPELAQLFLFSRTSKSAEALAYDLDDKRVRVVGDLELVPLLDYVIITLSGTSDEARAASIRKRTTTYQLRQDELKYNLGAFVGLVPFLQTLPLSTKIIIVTNPVDELTNYLYQKLGADRDIYGFGIQLDQRRFREYLNQECFCIGTHGAAIPLLGLDSAEAYKELSQKVDKILFEKVKASGIPHHIAGEEFKTFFQDLNSREEKTVLVSYLLRDEFYGIQSIAISLPFTVKQGKVVGIKNDLTLNPIEQELLEQQVEQIKVSVSHILESHKYLEDYK